MKVCLDPGHGGRDPGTTGPAGLIEKNLVLDISLKLRDYLLAGWECEITLTRESDVFIPLGERVKIANDWEQISSILFIVTGILRQTLTDGRALSIFQSRSERSCSSVLFITVFGNM